MSKTPHASKPAVLPDRTTDPSPASPPREGSAVASLSFRKIREFLGRIGPAGPLAVIAGTLPALGGFLLLGLLGVVGPWLAGHDGVGVAVYIAGFSVAAGLALLPTYAQAVLGGWSFGLAGGTAAALAGFGGAALIGYAIARRASGDRVVTLIESNPKWDAVYRALIRSGFWKTLLIVILVRVPSSPFALTNLVMAATRVPLPTYILGTLLGMAPRTIAAVFIGSHMAELDFGQARNIWLVVGGIVGILIAFAIINQIANNAIARVTAGGDDAIAAAER
jgi:uncharacterized membrane protein YdjX (TVP38/TMEM64 family)